MAGQLTAVPTSTCGTISMPSMLYQVSGAMTECGVCFRNSHPYKKSSSTVKKPARNLTGIFKRNLKHISRPEKDVLFDCFE